VEGSEVDDGTHGGAAVRALEGPTGASQLACQRGALRQPQGVPEHHRPPARLGVQHPQRSRGGGAPAHRGGHLARGARGEG
jgi:hypothetical protein